MAVPRNGVSDFVVSPINQMECKSAPLCFNISFLVSERCIYMYGTYVSKLPGKYECLVRPSTYFNISIHYSYACLLQIADHLSNESKP